MIRKVIAWIKYFWWWIRQSKTTREQARMYVKILTALQPNIKGGDMEEDMRNSPTILEKVKDRHYAVNLYRAMCNNAFTCAGKKEPWSCTWRYAGELVAELRDQGEDYMDFYCSGNESYVDEEIANDLKDLGWSVEEG